MGFSDTEKKNVDVFKQISPEFYSINNVPLKRPIFENSQNIKSRFSKDGVHKQIRWIPISDILQLFYHCVADGQTCNSEQHHCSLVDLCGFHWMTE